MLVLFVAWRSHITRNARQPLKPLLFLWINGRVGEFFVFLGLGFQFVRLLWHGVSSIFHVQLASVPSATSMKRASRHSSGAIEQRNCEEINEALHNLIENRSAIVLVGSLNFRAGTPPIFWLNPYQGLLVRAPDLHDFQVC
jgi:hypothetical protein